jgi:hypothetical protein
MILCFAAPVLESINFKEQFSKALGGFPILIVCYASPFSPFLLFLVKRYIAQYFKECYWISKKIATSWLNE